MTHKFGPNGHIVDAFIAHIKGMTEEQWGPVIAAWDAAWDAAGAVDLHHRINSGGLPFFHSTEGWRFLSRKLLEAALGAKP
jgi:hypothetical protein